MNLLQDSPRRQIFTAVKEIAFSGIDEFLQNKWLGFDGREKVFICENDCGYTVEYLAGIRTAPYWEEKDLDELERSFLDHGWTVGAGILVWKIFQVPSSGDFYEALGRMIRARCFIKSYGEVYTEKCTGISSEMKLSVSDLMTAVEKKYTEKREAISLERRYVDLEDFQEYIINLGFVCKGQGAG